MSKAKNDAKPVIVLDRKTYDKKTRYWSNSCGDLYDPASSQEITEEDLPEPLRKAFSTLWYEGEFGLNCFLVEHDGEYGISLEAGYDDCYAADLGVSRKALDEFAETKAQELSDLISGTQFFYGKKIQEWSDGSKDTLVTAFIPWDTQKAEYQRIGHIFEENAYRREEQ